MILIYGELFGHDGDMIDSSWIHSFSPDSTHSFSRSHYSICWTLDAGPQQYVYMTIVAFWREIFLNPPCPGCCSWSILTSPPLNTNGTLATAHPSKMNYIHDKWAVPYTYTLFILAIFGLSWHVTRTVGSVQRLFFRSGNRWNMLESH